LVSFTVKEVELDGFTAEGAAVALNALMGSAEAAVATKRQAAAAAMSIRWRLLNMDPFP
jgi:hypothetical protein